MDKDVSCKHVQFAMRVFFLLLLLLLFVWCFCFGAKVTDGHGW